MLSALVFLKHPTGFFPSSHPKKYDVSPRDVKVGDASIAAVGVELQQICTFRDVGRVLVLIEID